jgi:hypothetical protein
VGDLSHRPAIGDLVAGASHPQIGLRRPPQRALHRDPFDAVVVRILHRVASCSEQTYVGDIRHPQLLAANLGALSWTCDLCPSGTNRSTAVAFTS